MRIRAIISQGNDGAKVRMVNPRKRKTLSIIRALLRPILSLTNPATGAKIRCERIQMLATQLSSSLVSGKSLPARSRPKSKRSLGWSLRSSGCSLTRTTKIADDEMLAPWSKATRLMANPQRSWTEHPPSSSSFLVRFPNSLALGSEMENLTSFFSPSEFFVSEFSAMVLSSMLAW